MSAGGPSRPLARRGGVGWSAQATARDVAAIAGVSAQTVSRVVNNAGNVRPQTRARVLEAMEMVGYTPNAAARTLRSGRSDTIGVIARHLARTGEACRLQAVSAAARARGFAVTWLDDSSTSAPDLVEAVGRMRQDVAGLIVLGQGAADLDRVRTPGRIPVVVADSRPSALPAVGFDQGGGAHLAVAHLLGLGHRSVHLLAGPVASLQATQREEAWRATLMAADRPVPEPVYGDWTPASGYWAGQRLAADESVTAVFAANDEMAMGLLRALHEAGRRVPQDVSVAGFDDVVAGYLWPPLTTVHQDFSALGENLVRLLLRQIDPALVAGEEVTTLVPARLVVRESTGPVPAG